MKKKIYRSTFHFVMSYFSKQPSDRDGSLVVLETLVLELAAHRGHMTLGGRHFLLQPIDARDTGVMELREGGEEALHPDMGGQKTFRDMKDRETGC